MITKKIFLIPESLSLKIFCKKSLIVSKCTFWVTVCRFKAQTDQKKMLIYWKCCEHSNSVLRHNNIHCSFDPFDHLAFTLHPMYAKVSCDASHKHKNIYKHKLSYHLCLLASSSHISSSLFGASIVSILWSSFHIVLMVVKMLLVCLKDNYLELSPLVVLTVCVFYHPMVHYIVTKAISSWKARLVHCGAKLK